MGSLPFNVSQISPLAYIVCDLTPIYSPKFFFSPRENLKVRSTAWKLAYKSAQPTNYSNSFLPILTNFYFPTNIVQSIQPEHTFFDITYYEILKRGAYSLKIQSQATKTKVNTQKKVWENMNHQRRRKTREIPKRPFFCGSQFLCISP